MIPLVALLLFGAPTGSTGHFGTADSAYTVMLGVDAFRVAADARADGPGFAQASAAFAVPFVLTDPGYFDIEGTLTRAGKWEHDLPGADYALELTGPGLGVFIFSEQVGVIPISADLVLGPGAYTLAGRLFALTPDGFGGVAHITSALALTGTLHEAAVKIPWPETFVLLVIGVVLLASVAVDARSAR